MRLSGNCAACRRPHSRETVRFAYTLHPDIKIMIREDCARSLLRMPST
jgi:hypothetical protein